MLPVPTTKNQKSTQQTPNRNKFITDMSLTSPDNKLKKQPSFTQRLRSLSSGLLGRKKKTDGIQVRTEEDEHEEEEREPIVAEPDMHDPDEDDDYHRPNVFEHLDRESKPTHKHVPTMTGTEQFYNSIVHNNDLDNIENELDLPEEQEHETTNVSQMKTRKVHDRLSSKLDTDLFGMLGHNRQQSTLYGTISKSFDLSQYVGQADTRSKPLFDDSEEEDE
jgi:hypothetical protein